MSRRFIMAGWMLFEVSLAMALLIMVLVGCYTLLLRQAFLIQEIRHQLMADILLFNGLEGLSVTAKDQQQTFWVSWRALSQQLLPEAKPRYHCAGEICSLCFYWTTESLTPRCQSVSSRDFH